MSRRLLSTVGVLTTCGALASASAVPQTRTQTADASSVMRDLTEVSLTELAEMKVTSVSKRPEKRSSTAAAIHVVTEEDIQASGARTLADLLRLAPGVHVAQTTSSQWAIGIRGFTSVLARDQLALIDGRSLYSPLFAGTYWDVQDTVLKDIERIEIVRGPGGTLWGANAMNGIVNIITKSAKDTQGGTVVLGGGTEQRGFGRVRYGGRLGENGYFRVYGKYFDRDAAYHRDGDNFDGWHMGQGGGRADWDLGYGQSLTVQGDLYVGRAGRRVDLTSYEPPYVSAVSGKVRLGGGNILGRWTRTDTSDGQLQVQAYYDRTDRTDITFEEHRDTGDLDAQYRFRPFGRHHLVVGGDYRLSSGRTSGNVTLGFIPPKRTDPLAALFVEDAFDAIPDKLQFTVGSKLVWNDYSGADLQPSARVSWSPHAKHSLWAAVTRAIRTPSRIERDVSADFALAPTAPLFGRLLGSSAFDNEIEHAYEVGYRLQVSERMLVDVAAFYNDYPNLLSLEPGVPFAEPGRTIVPFLTANGLRARVSGVEVWSDIRVASFGRLRPSYSYLNMDLTPRPGSQDTASAAAEDASPRHEASLRSSLTLPAGFSLNGWFRWLSRLPSQQVPAITTLDARAAWQANDRWGVAVVGQNLLQPHHLEFGGGIEIQRSVYGEVTCRF
jgi:iron complex outermembrane recepter protein